MRRRLLLAKTESATLFMRAYPTLEPARIFPQLHQIDGVIFLKEESAGVTPTPELRAGLYASCDSNLLCEVHSSLQEFGHVRVGCSLGVDAQDGFGAGPAQH